MPDSTEIQAVVTFNIAAENAAAGELYDKLRAAAAPAVAQTLTISRDDGLTLTGTFADQASLDLSMHTLGPLIGELSELGTVRSLKFYGDLSVHAQRAFKPFRPTMHALPR